jgi:hypothetical protein
MKQKIGTDDSVHNCLIRRRNPESESSLGQSEDALTVAQFLLAAQTGDPKS